MKPLVPDVNVDPRRSTRRERGCLAENAVSVPLVALAFFLTGVGTAAAQTDSTAVLQGTVVSAMTGGPLADAQVALVNARRGTMTDSSGAFVLGDVPPGIHSIEVRLLGFAEERAPIILPPGQVTSAVFLLSRTILQLDDIEVTVRDGDSSGKLAGFEKRKAKGFGYFLTRADIEERNPGTTSDLFGEIPGFRVGASGADGALVRVARRSSVSHCRPTIYVDGVLKLGLRVDDVGWNDILAMEIYHGAAETPPRFKFRGGNCGTVVMWTKDGSPDRRN